MPTDPMPVPWDFTDHPRPPEPWEIPDGQCSLVGCEVPAAVYNWDFESWSYPQVCSAHGDARCKGCGTVHGGDLGGMSGCGNCLPQTCAKCGGINHIATGRNCSCWVSLEAMPPADVKALFARDADLSDGPTLGV